MVKRRSKRLLVLFCDGRQNPVGKIIVRVRLVADADLYARKDVGAEAGNDRLDAVVPAGGTLGANPQPSGRLMASKITMIRSGGI